MASWPVFLPTCSGVFSEWWTQLIYGLRHSDHISDALISLHWLRAQERVLSKTAVIMYKATHGTAPSNLSQLVHVVDLPGRHSLRSARTNRLLVPSMKLSTVGGRAFPVAGPTIWNSLQDNMTSAPSVNLPSAFKNISVPALVPWHYQWSPVNYSPPPVDAGVIVLLGPL